jgi:outer membrane protein TolC
MLPSRLIVRQHCRHSSKSRTISPHCAYSRPKRSTASRNRRGAQSLSTFEVRYEGGLELYLEVVTSQTVALANQRNDIELMRRQLDVSVLLIKALGGGWNTQQLPKL